MILTSFYLLKKGMGGIFYITKRYSKSINKYMLSYDVNKPSNYITYLDANNFYGYAMSKNLPYGGLKWLNQKEIDRFDVNSIGKDSSDGYMLEVDLGYPDELRVLRNNYPLAPDKLEITYDMLSNYCKKIQINME